MALDLLSNPDWLAAVRREREIREAAYLGLPTFIAEGISLAPLALEQQMVLFLSGNPIVCGGACSETDAALFLWACQPDYGPDNLAGRMAYFDYLATLPLDWRDVIGKLHAFYIDSSLDAPGSRRGSTEAQAPALCGAAVYEGEFLEAYGWLWEYTKRQPIVCLNQRLRYLRMKKPKHGIMGGRLSNAVEKRVVMERRAKIDPPVPPTEAQQKEIDELKARVRKRAPKKGGN